MAGVLARYKSRPVPSLGPGNQQVRFNCPVTQLGSGLAEGWVQDSLRAAGYDPLAFGLRLRVWQGPLEGIALREGQFKALEEGAADDVAPPPAQQAQRLAEDCELLLEAGSHTPYAYFEAMGSESEFAVLPLMLEGAAGQGAPAPAAAGQEEGAAPQPCDGGAGGEAAAVKAAAQGSELSSAEVYSALAVQEVLYSKFRQAIRFGSAEEWIRHMDEKAIRLDPDATDPEAPAADTENPDPKAAFRSAVRVLAGGVRYPVWQVVLGCDNGLFNPVPVAWLGRARSGSGSLLGLLSAVVWT